jgi:hypothetical protein
MLLSYFMCSYAATRMPEGLFISIYSSWASRPCIVGRQRPVHGAVVLFVDTAPCTPGKRLCIHGAVYTPAVHPPAPPVYGAMYGPSIHGRLTTRRTLRIQGGSKTGTQATTSSITVGPAGAPALSDATSTVGAHTTPAACVHT